MYQKITPVDVVSSVATGGGGGGTNVTIVGDTVGLNLEATQLQVLAALNTLVGSGVTVDSTYQSTVVVDTASNYFFRIDKLDSTGIIATVFVPIGGAPPAPVGTTTPVEAEQLGELAAILTALGALTDGTQVTQVTNFPATQAVTQSGNWSQRLQDGAGNAIGSTSGALNVSVTTPISISGTIAATQSGAWTQRLQDGSGNAITSTAIGGKQRLDVNLSSAGSTGSAVPTTANLMGGSDGTNLRALKTDTNGILNTTLRTSTGTAVATNNRGELVAAPSVYVANIFGRAEIAAPFNQLSIKMIVDKLPRQIEEVTGGGASASTYSSTNASCTLTVAAALNQFVMRETYERGNYQSGKSMVAELSFVNLAPQTGVTKRVGYFTSATTSPYNSNFDGIFLTSTAGVVRFQVWRSGTSVFDVAQSSWNDPLNGTGTSGVTIDWTKPQVVKIEFGWLGYAGVRLWLFLAGQWQLVHEVTAVNDSPTSVLMSSPNKPLRWDIISDGTGGGTLVQTCGAIYTEGEENRTGRSMSVPPVTGTSSFTASGTTYVSVAFRNASAAAIAGAAVKLIGIDHINTTNQACIVWVLRNPTLSAALTYTAITNSPLEYATNVLGLVTVTAFNEVLYQMTVSSGSNSKAFQEVIQDLGTAFSGTSDVIVIAVTPLAANLTARSSANIVIL